LIHNTWYTLPPHQTPPRLSCYKFYSIWPPSHYKIMITTFGVVDKILCGLQSTKKTISLLKIFAAYIVPVIASTISIHYYILVTSYLHSVITTWYDLLYYYHMHFTQRFSLCGGITKCCANAQWSIVYLQLCLGRFLQLVILHSSCSYCIPFSRWFKISKST